MSPEPVGRVHELDELAAPPDERGARGEGDFDSGGVAEHGFHPVRPKHDGPTQGDKRRRRDGRIVPVPHYGDGGPYPVR